jgi:hypothetical protein
MVQRDWLHLSIRASRFPMLFRYAPTATHSYVVRHETPSNPASVVAGGIGVASTSHRDPFHLSTRGA